MSDVTQILSRLDAGDRAAAEQLLPLVYDELKKLAAARLAHERPGQTLQATALVHEAYLRLVGPTGNGQPWNSRGHFFGAAAEAMRRLLVEQARRKKRIRHGGELQRVVFDSQLGSSDNTDDNVVAVSDALERLAVEEPETAEVVKLRYFVGLTIEETAAVLKTSVSTVNRHWNYARAWLFQELG